ncbi:hypothetical protein CMO93_04895 [Candidatus Woesearchaeota archaeon]|nr:hypothetical protein [Candidatus Woesearchaeota archaeon]|tara:strand:+ start:437 stop:1048 length:612 start_codon:yes stop_codon:yes gene_type:complete
MPEETTLTEKTHIRCKIIIEVLGKPKEHVEKALQMYVNKINDDPDLIILKKDFADVKEKEELWATFVELEMVIKGIPKLIAFCFDYMPSSVEILKPEELHMNKSTIANFANDLQARLHDVDMIVKKLKNENEFLKKNMNAAVKNVVLISLAYGPLDKEKLSKITGIKDEGLKSFLDELIKENRITEKNGTYTVVKETVKNAEK